MKPFLVPFLFIYLFLQQCAVQSQQLPPEDEDAVFAKNKFKNHLAPCQKNVEISR